MRILSCLIPVTGKLDQHPATLLRELLEQRLKFQIDGRIVSRVRTHHYQHIHFARFQVIRQLTDGLGVLHRIDLDRVNEADRLANIAQR